jgi:ribosomal protein S14
MSYSNHNKVYKQLKVKPTKLKKYMKHNAPKKRSCGKAKISCRITGTHRGVIRKYGLNVCRQAFRELAKKIGFKKYS